MPQFSPIFHARMVDAQELLWGDSGPHKVGNWNRANRPQSIIGRMFQPTMSQASGTRVRWWVLAMLFAATTINYLDRIVFSVLIPVIRKDLHLNDQDYGYVNGAFQI